MSNGDLSYGVKVIRCGYKNSALGTINQTIVGRRDAWAFASPRPKPRPLTDTGGAITRLWEDNKTHTYGQRYGSCRFVYVGVLPEWVKETNSQGDSEVRRLKAAAKLGQGSINLAQTIGEWKQTQGLIANRILQIAEAANALRRGNIKHLKEVLSLDLSRRQDAKLRNLSPSRRLADGWLEVNYGWAPLIGDVYGGMEAFRNGIATRGARVRGTSGSSQSSRGRWDTNQSLSGNYLAQISDSPLASRAVYRGRVSNPQVRTLQELGLLNPALLAWELLPFSFVVDWVIPVGTALSALTSGLGLSGVRGSVIHERRVVRGHTGGPIRTVRQDISRTALASVTSGWPQDNFNPGLFHVATATALLIQAFGRKTR